MTKEELKARFETGDKPTQEDFFSLIDATVAGSTTNYNYDSSSLVCLLTIDNLPKVIQRLSLTNVEENTIVRFIDFYTGQVLDSREVSIGETAVFNIDLLKDIKVYVLGKGILIYSYIGG